jgi:hypothetical protein
MEGVGAGGEMAQLMYAHMIKWIKWIKKTAKPLNILAKQQSKIHNAIYQNCRLFGSLSRWNYLEVQSE